MNLSNFAHAGLAMLAQVVVMLVGTLSGATLFEAAVMGALFSVGFYFGREVAQHERKVGTPPWWSGFVMAQWSRDALLDFLTPAVACALVCALAFVFG